MEICISLKNGGLLINNIFINDLKKKYNFIIMNEFKLDNFLIKVKNNKINIFDSKLNKEYSNDLNDLSNIEYSFHNKEKQLNYDKKNNHFNLDNINELISTKINEKNLFLETNNNMCSLYFREDYIKTKPDEPSFNKYYLCKINIPSL